MPWALRCPCTTAIRSAEGNKAFSARKLPLPRANPDSGGWKLEMIDFEHSATTVRLPALPLLLQLEVALLRTLFTHSNYFAQIADMETESTEITLLQMRNLTLKLGRVPSSSVVQLLEETIWGTPGAIRYQHLDTAEKIRHLHAPWFLVLEKERDAIGVLCLDQRLAGHIPAFYIRYFSFAESMRRKDAHATAESASGSKGQGIFKRFSSSFFEHPEALLQAAATSKAVFYAFVELENARSRDMVAQMGLDVCGQFKVLIFSRLFPRHKAKVRRAQPSEYPALREIVRTAYADHAFFEDHGLFYKNDFFVLEQDGKIVAGCQAHRVSWRVVEIPGFAGKWMMHVLPWIPLVSRLFNPSKFEFVAIEGLFHLPGYADRLQELLEGVLALQGVYSALLWLSPKATLYETVRKEVRLGLMQSLKKDSTATVVMRGYGLTPEELATLRTQATYISAFDAT